MDADNTLRRLDSIETLLSDAQKALDAIPEEELRGFVDHANRIKKKLDSCNVQTLSRYQLLLVSLGLLAYISDPGAKYEAAGYGSADRLTVSGEGKISFGINDLRSSRCINSKWSNAMIKQFIAQIESNLHKTILQAKKDAEASGTHLGKAREIFSKLADMTVKSPTPNQ